MTSIMLAGGMIFMLSYASLTVMTAVCKYCALGKNQSGAQWGALLVIVLGLLINAEAAEQAGGDVFYGVLAGFGAAVRARAPRWCFLVFSSQAPETRFNYLRTHRTSVACTQVVYAVVYVLSEATLTGADPPVPPALDVKVIQTPLSIFHQ
jgi:hypothetical protein